MRFAFSSWPPVAAFSLLLGLAAYTGGDASKGRGPAQPPLYDRLGGQPAMIAVVDDFMQNVSADPRIARRFNGADTPQFRAALVDQLCVSTGGPCHYKGPSMKEAHSALGISDAEFNAMVQDLRRALARRDVPVDTQVEFATALEPLRDDVVSPLPPTQSVVSTQSIHHPAAKHGVGKKSVAKKPAPKGKATAKKPVRKKPASHN